MLFEPAPLPGAYTIGIERLEDERGFFARSYCAEEFAHYGLETRFVQANNSFSARKGTLRGFHYQLPPKAEVKLVRCIKGAFLDVIIDLRPDSSSFGKSFTAELNETNRRMMYVPRGFAHALFTLQENTEALYMVSAGYAPQQERGIRYNDAKFAVEWPLPIEVISPKDAQWPDFDPVYHGVEFLRGI